MNLLANRICYLILSYTVHVFPLLFLKRILKKNTKQLPCRIRQSKRTAVSNSPFLLVAFSSAEAVAVLELGEERQESFWLVSLLSKRTPRPEAEQLGNSP